MAERTCSQRGCNKKHSARGLCQMHYQQAKKAGTLSPVQLELTLKPIHSLTNVNRDQRIADCSVCGPSVRIRVRVRKGHGGVECWTKDRSRKAAETERFFARPRTPEERHAALLMRCYKLTVERKEQMIAAQGGACAICHEIPDVWMVDHDHACCPGEKSCGQCVRGLLCHHCNIALAWLRDRPEIASSAAEYLCR